VAPPQNLDDAARHQPSDLQGHDDIIIIEENEDESSASND
jgi:hypothetical protein